MKNPAGRAIAKRLLPIYEAVAPFEVMASTKASCARGCSGCCYQWVPAQLAETVLIVDWLQRQPAWQGRLAALRAAAEEQAAWASTLGDDPNHAFMESHRGCIFLDRATGDCGVYPVRPLVCRLHFVASDPKDCGPDANGTDVGIIDPGEAIAYAMPRLITFTQGMPFAHGGLAELIVAAFEYLERAPADFDRWVRARGVEMPPVRMSFDAFEQRFKDAAAEKLRTGKRWPGTETP
jgi:Fe-S-cluster containining protein